MSREQTKTAHYIQQLDAARSDGDWEAVPKLIKKIRKHAPDRHCLTLTAESEYAVTQASHQRLGTARPQTARPSTAALPQAPDISHYIPLLAEAIEKEHTYVEDEFQAQVCLGWIYWQLGQPSLAISNLSNSIEQEFSQLDGTNKESTEWTKVCALKAAYIKGTCQNRTGAVAEAQETFASALPILSSVSSGPANRKEVRCWAELFLTGCCMTLARAVSAHINSLLESETLSAFRAWAKFWDRQSPLPTGGHLPQAEIPRREIWREYYVTLSQLLEENLPFPITALAVTHTETSLRLQQRAELKKVEARYEALLLEEVTFPKAEDSSPEFESFVNIVIQNWRILCGSSWAEHELGEGGSEAVSRGVLDILYRAATKTFHSTTILRHLFTVHMTVAEFDLALKAFDTYLEIVKRGKARVEKTGEAEIGLDDDQTILITVSECIKALCQYGSQSAVEKAEELANFFENWLEKHHPLGKQSVDAQLENGNATPANDRISPEVLAMTWRCIGIGHAQWARLSFDAPARADTQFRAIKCFRKSLLPEYESTANVETLFALGILLAERRELTTAVEVVKSGLLSRSQSSPNLGPHTSRFARERSLIPLWHLLALLLSARQEFTTASKACEGAFEQFQDIKILFGELNLTATFRSDHLNSNEKPELRSHGVVDEMGDFEKENVLEVKITQLALIEVLEGPEVAVNASDELLSLYARLFGSTGHNKPTTAPKTAIPPPKSSADTIRSIKGSIFGRSSRSVRKANPTPTTENAALPIRPRTTQTAASINAPTIHITTENGRAGRPKSRLDQSHHHEKLQKRASSLTKEKNTRSSMHRSSSLGGKPVSTTNKQVATIVDGEAFFTPTEKRPEDQWLGDILQPSQVGLAISPDASVVGSNDSRHGPQKPLPPKSQRMTHKERALQPAHLGSTLAQDNRLPTDPYYTSKNPVTRFSKDQEKRRRTTTLVKIWLLIAGFYRRAVMYDDAKGAIMEAHKLVEGLEVDVSKDTTGNVSINNSGWGGGKSISQLWGDVFSERGYLAIAESSPYTALASFESALTRFPDHPSAIVGLSNILLDIYAEVLLPLPAIPPLVLPGPLSSPSASTLNTFTPKTEHPSPTQQTSSTPVLRHGPLGLPSAFIKPPTTPSTTKSLSSTPASTALLDKLAARDRAYGLLSMLTKLGSGWNYSEAWFALARAYEEGGQLEKTREVLWWCVELEEGRAVRSWEPGIIGKHINIPYPPQVAHH
ncbi:hypothetical protein B7494_g5025 [Chlorociboria aeruginascens]|nr:hypothetical protein B7494_g5025 [Chlorociboria aeruginascens]